MLCVGYRVPSVTSRAAALLESLTEGLHADLSAEDKRVIARGFFLICCTNFFSKLADLLASPKITLTWLMQALGAPTFAISLIVPIRESGSMLPQLLMARPVAAYARKARLYQMGAVVQAVAIFGMVLTAMVFTDAVAGWLIVALVTLFSLGRCLCSLVSKAVLGKVIPKSLRGQTTGWSATVAGLTSCAVAAYLLTQNAAQSVSTAVVLLMIASACWLLASLAYGFIDEPADTDSDAKDARQSMSERIAILRQDGDLRRFVLVRALFVSSALVAPYYILLSGEDSSNVRVLGALLLASGLAKLFSAVIWGRWSDRSSRTTMMISGSLVFSLGAVTTLVYLLSPGLLNTSWLIPLIYFGLEIAHQGVRVARKTYIVDLTSDQNRVEYVALSNSLIGALLLATGVLLGLLATFLDPIWLVATLSLLSLAGVALGTGLREV